MNSSIFSIKENVPYDVRSEKTLHETLKLKINRYVSSSVEDFQYTLSLTSEYFKLLITHSDKYKVYADGGVVFMVKSNQKNLDFVRIALKEGATMNFGNSYYIRLKIRAANLSGPIFHLTERTEVIQIKYSPPSPVNIRKNKLFSYSNNSVKFLKSVENADKIPITECTGASPTTTDVKQQNLSSGDGLCIIIVCMKFDDENLKTRDPTLHDIYRLVRFFREMCHWDVKTFVNSTTDDVIEDMSDCVMEIIQRYRNVVLFIISHGNAEGFYTKDGHIKESELVDCLGSLLENTYIKKIILLAYCRSIEDVSLPSDQSTTVFDIVIRLINEIRLSNPTPFSKYCSPSTEGRHHLLVAYSSEQGTPGYRHNGYSVYCREFLDIAEDKWKRDKSVDLQEVVEICEKKLSIREFSVEKECPLKSKKIEISVYQRPWHEGGLNGGLFIYDTEVDTVTESNVDQQTDG